MNVLRKQWVLSTTSFLFLPIGLYAPRGLALLFVLTAVLLIFQELIERRTLQFTSWRFYLAAMAIPLYGAISSIWSITPAVSIKRSVIIWGTIIIGMLLANNSILRDSKEKLLFEKWLIAGGLIGFTLLFAENITNAGLSRFAYELLGLNRDIRLVNQLGPLGLNSGMSVASLYLWPLGLTLFRRYKKTVSIPIIGFCFLGIILGASSSPFLALIVGLATLVITGVAYRYGPKLLIIATVLFTLVTPAIPNLLPDPEDPQSNLSRYYALSDIHRYLIWKTTVSHIKNKPIFGHGLDSTRALYSHEDKINYYIIENNTTGKSLTIYSEPILHHPQYDVDNKIHEKRKTIYSEPIPLHPHNAFLQLWLELGVVGAGFLAFFLVEILHLVQRVTQNRWEAAACYGIFTSGLTISSLSYGIWQSWWLASLLLAAAFMAVIVQSSANNDLPAQ